MDKIKSEIAMHFDQRGIWRIEGGDYYCYRREEEEFDRFLGKNGSGGFLLEIGSGRGRFATRYASHFKKIVAIDLSSNMLASLKDETGHLRINNISLFKADAEKLCFRDNSFDAVVASQVIGHCPNPEAMLKEMARVLKPGSRGIISTANYLSLPGLKQFISIKDCFIRKGGIITNIKEYRGLGRNFWLKHQRFVRDSYFSLKRFLKRSGLKIEKISGSGIFPTFLSSRLKFLEKKSSLFPVKYFCRTIIISFVKG